MKNTFVGRGVARLLGIKIEENKKNDDQCKGHGGYHCFEEENPHSCMNCCSCGKPKISNINISSANWRRWLPSIRFRLHIPFVRIETTILYERIETMGVEWYGLDIQIWKYHFNICLYWMPIQ